MILRSLSSRTIISNELHGKIARTCRQVAQDNSQVLAVRHGVNHSAVCAIDLCNDDDSRIIDTSSSYCRALFPAAY